jgi:hypothetical protein
MERGGELDTRAAPGNGDNPILQRLAQGVEVGSGELGELVEEEDAAVSECA